MTDDAMFWFDRMTALAWLLLAAAGVVLRIRRLIHLRQIILVEPVLEGDREYLASVKRSTYLRLLVKVVFLIGSLIALFHLPLLVAWRTGIIIALVCMIAETRSVDSIRERLGRAARAEESG